MKFSSGLHDYNNYVANETEYNTDRQIGSKYIFDGIYDNAMYIRKTRHNQMSEENIVSSDYTDDEIKSILDKYIVTLAFHKDESNKEKPVLQFDETNSHFGPAPNNRSAYNDLITEIKTRFDRNETTAIIRKTMAQKDWKIRAFTINDIGYKNSIVSTLNDLTKKLDKLTVALDKEREQKIEETLGFNPTIQNMYNMIFAHIDTFMSCFYNTLDMIKKSIEDDTDESRKYTRLCGGGIEVDVTDNILKSDSSNGGKLPPFTMFYKETTDKDSEDRKMTMVWPGSLNGGKDLAEVELVEAIVNATSLSKRRFDSVTPKNNIDKKDGALVPTNYYDLTTNYENPYLDILTEKTLLDESTVMEVLKVFVLRCFYSLLNGSYLEPSNEKENNGQTSSELNFTKKAKLVSDLEVSNIERAFQSIGMKPTRAFIQGLNKLSNNGDELISIFLKETELTFNKPVFSVYGNGNDLVYRWIEKNGSTGNRKSYLLPVGTFEMPVIKNYVNGSDQNKDKSKFIQIGPNGTSEEQYQTCYIYEDSGKIEDILTKYSSGDFVNAKRLFNAADEENKKVTGILNIPSYRKTKAGITSIFMDPFYYAQKSSTARAYLFLMGIQFGDDTEYFLPKKVKNGDYQTLMLLREGAFYWRQRAISSAGTDPITYRYSLNGSERYILPDIEKNDPRFGFNRIYDDTVLTNSTRGREDTLIDFFKKFAGEQVINANIPSTKLRLGDIERHLALWSREHGLNIKTLLNSGSLEYSVNEEGENVYFFENSVTLSELYNIEEHYRLGVCNGEIRTGVTIKDYEEVEKITSSDSAAFLRNFVDFCSGNNTIIDTCCFDDTTMFMSVRRGALSLALHEFVCGLKDTYGVSVENMKDNPGYDSAGIPEDTYKSPEYFKSDDFKLACYIALKSMYDRWLCSRRRECWNFSCNPEKMNKNEIKSDFSRFFYIDEFYHDIGMKERPNLSKFVEMTCKLGGFTEKSDSENLASTSIMKILSTTAQYANCALLTLPTMLGLTRVGNKDMNNNSIEDVFKAYTYNDAVRGGGVETSFIVLYSSQKSSILNNSDDKGRMGYKDDGFDIANTWGEIVPQPMLTDSPSKGFVVPSFGVTFAKQNQSYFKDVRLSMEDHQVTEFSVRNEVMISYQSNRGPRETSFIGQDLYSVYSNYSYSCTVSMMGDAQITPLMYFQLNNIPMWKGAYIITSVHHDISVHGMETVFTGVRQARPTLPLKSDILDVTASDATKQTPYSQDDNYVENQPSEKQDYSDKTLDKIDIDRVDSIVFILNRNIFFEDGKFMSGALSAYIKYSDGTEENINNIASTIEPVSSYGYEPRERIENYTFPDAVFNIPEGLYSPILIENVPVGSEYRNLYDTFYSFTDKGHILIDDVRLKSGKCEIILGEMNTTDIDVDNPGNISFGGTEPIMIYGTGYDSKDSTTKLDESKALYREIFDLVKKMNGTKKPLSFYVIDDASLKNN